MQGTHVIKLLGITEIQFVTHPTQNSKLSIINAG